MIAPARHFPQSLFTRLAALCVLCPFMGHSAPPTPASEVLPDQREVWTPTDHLKQVLAKYPNAVMLSREQYESLVREAGQVRKPPPVAPRRATLSSANYQARVGGRVAQVTATYTVNVLSDEWAQLPLDFGGLALGAVTVDGEAALLSPQDAAPARASTGSSFLLLRGKGERVVVVEFSVPLDVAKGVSEFEIRPPSAAAGVFHLELPPDQRVESPQPITVKSTPQMTSVTATLSPANPVLALNWRGGGSQALGAQISASGTYTIDAEKVRAEFDLDLHTPLGNLAGAYSMALPADAKVLQVTGEEVADWSIKDGALRIALQPGERAAAKVRLVTESPSLGAAPKATLTLAVPHFDGIIRSEGSFSILGDDGVVVKEIATDSSLAPANMGGGTPHWIASYRFHAPPNSPRVTVEKVRPRFSADLDTRVEFKPEAIFIERTLTVHPERGEIFEAALTLPVGEELMAVRNPDESEPDWHLQDRNLGLRWANNDGGAAGRPFKIRTRMEPANWSQIGVDGLPFTLGDMKIEGAERVTGYIALQADDTFRLEAEPSETLERRDGRTTPVQGDYAWFRGADFTLRVKVAKRPGEVLAALTGYALPLEGILDLHAQIDYTFLHSGTRSVRIRVPKEIAANFHFDGPQIAERNLAGDVWTIVFQKELTGNYALKITGQIAVERTGSVSKPGDGADGGSEKESRFEIAVPVIAPLDVVRTSGVWVIEANTETEITFAAKGMNELDSLLAPGLADYQPRHRVIGVFTWLGPDYSLNLSGVRHAAASVLTSVVDRLDLDTVVSASGTERNEATFELRTAGAQYLDVQIPETSRLLSLSVNDAPVKPVGDRPEQVRVELPGMTNSNEALKVSVLYETPKTAWRGSGGYSTRAPKLSRMIPILRSQWRLFLPDGFEYSRIGSNLHAPPQESEIPFMIGILNGSFLPRRTPEVPFLPAPNGSPADTVRQLFIEAQGFYDSGRFDLATKRCDQILAIDKYSIPARKMEEKIDRAKGDYGVVAYGETRAAWMSDLDLQWAKPVRKYPPNKTENVDAADRNARIMKKLAGIIIPKLEFREATLREAIDFLKKKSVELDIDSPQGEKGVNIVLKLDTGGGEPIPPEAPAPTVTPIPGLVPIPAAPGAIPAVPVAPEVSPANARITVSLTNIPLIEALKYVTSLASVKLKVEPYAVFIVPQSVNTDVLVTKEYKIRPDLIPRAANAGSDAIKGTSGIADKKSARDWLTVNGVQFSSPGASAVYLRGSSRLVVRNTEDQLDLIDAIIESTQGRLPPSNPKYQPNRTRNAGVTVAARNERLIKKVERIIIPKLEFREATLREALDFLKKKSIDYDVDSPQGEKGVNIVLKLDAGMATDLADTRITVSLTNIPLIEALKYVTSLASLKLKVEPYAVFIVPQSVNTDVLVTKEYRIRPDLIPGVSDRLNATKGAVAVADKESPKNWLTSNGVQFSSPAASAVYLSNPSRLIVRNTQDQLDLIDTIVESNALGPEPAAFAGKVISGESDAAEKRKAALGQKLERIVIPKVELREATVREAVDFLLKKARDVDMDSPVGDRGVNIAFNTIAIPEQEAPRITVSLTNTPLVEALRYVTALAGLKYTLTPQGVSIVDSSVDTDLITKEWRVRGNLLPQTDGIGVVREAARKWLESEGVRFQGEASAVFFSPVGRQKMSLDSNGGATSSVFLPASGRLVVRNTSEQLDRVAEILASNNLAEPDEEASKLADSQRVSGLLPMKLDLPKIGRMVVLDGLSAADRVEFRYEDWWARARHLWLWFVGGAFVCLFTAGSRPWWRTCWAVLALTLFPLVAMTSATPICNALLAGWLTSVIIQRVSVRLVFAPQRKEALA